jgi:hypothetical protein
LTLFEFGTVGEASRRSLGDALAVLKQVTAKGERKLPVNAPTFFLGEKWEKYVLKEVSSTPPQSLGATTESQSAGVNSETELQLDRRYYEIAALMELRDGLRSGDGWVANSQSRRFNDFDHYLLPLLEFRRQIANGELVGKLAFEKD